MLCQGGKAIAEKLEKEFGSRKVKRHPTGCSLLNLSAAWRLRIGTVVVIDEDVHGRVKPGKVKEILSHTIKDH